MLQCPACDSIYFQIDSVFSEDEIYTQHPATGEVQWDLAHRIDHWPYTPTSKRPTPEWVGKLSLVDSDLESLMSSVYVALDHNLDVLAAIGVRTAFDRASELLGIDPSRAFSSKLSDLVTAGKIGSEEQDILDALTDAGSAAAHRGWKPSAEELDTMMSIIEAFLYRTFLLGEAAKRLRAQVPARQKASSETAP